MATVPALMVLLLMMDLTTADMPAESLPLKKQMVH